MGKIIGIDLGTTNSRMAFMDGENCVLIPWDKGRHYTPSILAIDEKGDWCLGEEAKQIAKKNPANAIYSIKSLIGKTFSEIAIEMSLFPYEILVENTNSLQIKLNQTVYSPTELAAVVFKQLKQRAEDYIGEKVTDAIITVPTCFNNNQRRAIQTAGEIAGLNVIRLINETTAAALAFGINKKSEDIIAVYDFGGGSLNFTIFTLGNDVVEVKATNGDVGLGGDDFDKLIIYYIFDEFYKKYNVEIGKDASTLWCLKEAAIKAKIDLDENQQTEIKLPAIFDKSGEAGNLNIILTKRKFEELSDTLIQRIVKLSKATLRDAELLPNEIKDVLIIGNTGRIPRMQQEIKKLFSQEPNNIKNASEMPAIGAAIQGGIIANEIKQMLILDVLTNSLAIETVGGVSTKLIQKNITIPARLKEIFSTSEDNQKSVEVHLLQGEHDRAENNCSICHFIVDGIRPAPRGVPKIEITFFIDASGTLQVTAKDLSSNSDRIWRFPDEGDFSPASQDRDVEEPKDEKGKSANDIQSSEKVSKEFSTIDDRYSIEKILGKGGFGVVYLAKDSIVGRNVAIKVLNKEYWSDKKIIARFENDARIAARLNHPNIVSIYDLDLNNYNIVMEYLDAGSVRDWLIRTSMIDLKSAAEITIAVLTGLQAAHSRGLIHRDIKPENILLNKNGYIKICDFGIAHDPSSSMLTIQTKQHTYHPGTLLYMSPEQICGEKLDGRSDIYSVGALFYEMLSGKSYIPQEFHKNDYTIAMAVIQHNPKLLGGVFSKIPKRVNHIITKMMHKDRNQRFTSAEEACNALNSLL